MAVEPVTRIQTGSRIIPPRRIRRLSPSFAALPQKPDPKPRWGWRALRNVVFLVAGLIGGTIAERQVWRDVTAPLQTQQATQTGSARAARTVGHVASGALFQLLAMQAFCLALVAGSRIQRSIRPETLWADLHQQGITGKGMKVAILDQTVERLPSIPDEQIQRLDPSTEDQQAAFRPTSHHGSFLADWAHSALPDAELISVAAINSTINKKMRQNEAAFFQTGRQDPTKLTVDNLLACYVPSIRHKADGIKLALEQGAQVINTSLGMTLSKLPALVDGQLAQARAELTQTPAQADLPPYIAALETLSSTLKRPFRPGAAMDSLMQPWLEALDLAYVKEVPVVFAAGNAGDETYNGKNGIGGFDFLGYYPHPALIMVGSTNHAGKISLLSTEWSNGRQPDIAANGSGEVDCVRHPVYGLTSLKKRLFRQVFLPLANGTWTSDIQAFPPQGTSFAAMDVTTTIAMMKAVNPKLPIKRIREILTQAALETTLPLPDAFHIWRDRALTAEERQQEITRAKERRVGAGLIARLESVRQAQAEAQQAPSLKSAPTAS